MTHYSQVSDQMFKQIKSGHKIIEPRLNDEAHRRIKISDLIVVVNRTTKEEVVAKVVGVLRFKSFAELFALFPARYFGVENQAEAIKMVRQWYTPEAEAEHGVLGVKLHVLKKTT